jgi:hypothetical protein
MGPIRSVSTSEEAGQIGVFTGENRVFLRQVIKSQRLVKSSHLEPQSGAAAGRTHPAQVLLNRENCDGFHRDGVLQNEPGR